MSNDIKKQFDTAVKEILELPKRPGNETMLRLYSLYKQATEGDIDGSRPGIFDLTGRAKYDAWVQLKGTSVSDAMQKYVELVNGLKGQ